MYVIISTCDILTYFSNDKLLFFFSLSFFLCIFANKKIMAKIKITDKDFHDLLKSSLEENFHCSKCQYNGECVLSEGSGFKPVDECNCTAETWRKCFFAIFDIVD